MRELKPCPFCNGQNISIISCYDDACENVYCEGCDKVRYTAVCNAQMGGCGANCGWKSSKEEAENSWNGRNKQKFCNGCKHLSIDEDEQNLIKKQGGGIYPHICTKYKKRVLHNPYKEPYIHPCDECMLRTPQNDEVRR